MIKDFDFFKQQVRELAGVLNEFKSEAVQLRVAELLFQRMEIEPEGDRVEKQKNEIKTKAKSEVKQKEKVMRPKRIPKGGRPGPIVIVKQLIEEGFFKTPKVVQDVFAHCQSESGRNYNTDSLRIGLLRAARSKALQRRKNAEGQFEYYE